MNEDVMIKILTPAVAGLLAWVWALWRSHNDLRLKVAEECLKTNSLQEVKDELHALRDVVYRIAVKMDVPVFTEPFRR